MGFASFAVIARHHPDLHFLLFILCSLLADAGACTLNDVGDIDSDRLSTESSRKGRPLVIGTVTRKAALIQGFILFGLGLGLALYLGPFIFLFALSLVVISHQYSMKPLKMNGRPFISQLFWVGFAVIYYGAVSAYLIKYQDAPMGNVIDGLYFLAVMVLFLAIAETLAKDLRDLDNDRDSGKLTTTVRIGPKVSAISSFLLSTLGISLWAIPFFTIYDHTLTLRLSVLVLVIGWTLISLILCGSISKKYTKRRARQLHLGYLITLSFILLVTYIGGTS